MSSIPPVVTDHRVTIRAAMIRQYVDRGRKHAHAGDGAMTALAERMAPRWGLPVDSAKQKLSRFLAPLDAAPTMPWVHLCALMDELGLRIEPAGTINAATKESSCAITQQDT